MEYINPKDIFAIPAPVSHGVVYPANSKVLLTAGQVAWDKSGNVIGKNDMRAQARQVMDNLKHILKEAGGDLENIVKLTTFVTDISRLSEVLEVRKEYMGNCKPASTAVQVGALVHKDMLIEIEAVAVIPEKG